MNWSYKSYTSALADTGDYESNVEFTNGKDTLQTCGDEIEDEQCKQFCELLDLMPDLWSHKCDNAEFELSQSRKKNIFLEKALKNIRDAFYTDGETDIGIANTGMFTSRTMLKTFEAGAEWQSKQPIPTVDEDELVEAIKLIKEAIPYSSGGWCKRATEFLSKISNQ